MLFGTSSASAKAVSQTGKAIPHQHCREWRAGIGIPHNEVIRKKGLDAASNPFFSGFHFFLGDCLLYKANILFLIIDMIMLAWACPQTLRAPSGHANMLRIFPARRHNPREKSEELIFCIVIISISHNCVHKNSTIWQKREKCYLFKDAK